MYMNFPYRKKKLTCYGCILAGSSASFEIQLEDNAGNITWFKENKPLDDRLADRISTSELPGNYYRLELKHCWLVFTFEWVELK